MGKKSREKRERNLEKKEVSKIKLVPKTRMEKIYFTIVQWGTYLALFAPIIFIRDYFFPFVVPKTIFFRIVVDIVFIAYLLLVITNRKYLPKINPLTIAVLFFIGVFALTSFTGANFDRSFWSTFERMTGLLTFLHLFVFFIILTSVFKERRQWERILTASIIVGGLICVYMWISEEAATRGGGTLGNTSFFSAYMLFNIFFAAILIFIKRGVWKFFYGTLLFLFLATFFFNEEPTRGAIGALVGGILIVGIGYLIFYLLSAGKPLLKKIGFALITLLILGSIGLSQLDFVKDKTLEYWESNSMQSRLVVWKMGWESWLEKPVLGWGPENFNIPFAKNFDPELPLTRDLWYDRVHNIFLDLLVMSGVLGFIFYFAIYAVAIIGLIKIIPKIIERKNVVLPLGMICLLMVYVAQNIWVFDMISSYIVLFLSFAFISFLIYPPKEETEEVEKEKQNILIPLICSLLIIVTLFGFYVGNIKVAQASKATVRGLALPLEQSIQSFQKALVLSPISQFEVPEQFSSTIINFASQAEKQNQTTLTTGFAAVEEVLKSSIEKNPSDFRLQLFLGRYYNNLFQMTGDQQKLNLADETFNNAKELSPRNQQIFWSLAQTRLFQGRQREAIEYLKQAVDLEPRYEQSHWYLAMAYNIIGEYQLALEEIQTTEDLGYDWKSSLNNLKLVIDIHRKLGNLGEIVSLYEKAITLSPEDEQLWASLADAYADIGEIEKARAAANKVLELNPDNAPQIEDFLQSIGY